MITLLLISILTLCRSMTTGSLTCGGSIIENPAEVSCCNEVQFSFRSQVCCNGIVQSAACLTKAVPTLPSGPSLVIRSDPVVGTSILGSNSAPNSVATLNQPMTLGANDINALDALDVDIEEVDTDTDNDNDTDDEGDDNDTDGSSESVSSESNDSSASNSSDDTSESNDSDSASSESNDSASNDSDDDSDDTEENSSSASNEESSSSDSNETDDTNDANDADGSGFGAFLDGENSHNNGYNANASQNMDYYVKITLINMWLILGLILIVNVIFYWCYCRQNRQRMKMDRVRSNNGFIDDATMAPRSDIDAEDDLI